IDVRDRLSAGLSAAPHERAPSWWARWRRSASAPDPWREGLAMTLRRLDRVLADRRITPIVTVGRPFSPAVARAVATRDDPSVAEGWVIVESRAGFEWDGELLRAAEVIVAKRAGSKYGADEGEAERLILPSVVGLDQDGGLLVGEAARNQYILHPERTVRSIKRLMGSDRKVSLDGRDYT